jgi:hypothetical protein
LFEDLCNKYIDKNTLRREVVVNVEIDDFSLINESFVNNIYSM